MRFWTVVLAVAAAVAVAWWWRKQAKAVMNGTARTVSAPPQAGTAGVQASLMANPTPKPAIGIAARTLAPAANAGNEGVSTFASAFAVNSPSPVPTAPRTKVAVASSSWGWNASVR